MSQYKLIYSGNISIWESPNKFSSVIGALKSGAVIEAEQVDDFYKIQSIVSGEHSGVSEGYCYIKNPVNGVYNFEPYDQVNAETGSEKEKVQEVYNDDSFTLVYSGFVNDDKYRANLQDGLRVSNLRGIMGLPHQFLVNTDSRLDLSDDDDAFGRVFSEKIVYPMPLMFITPGSPSFMSSFNKKQRDTIIDNITSTIGKIGGIDDLIDKGGGKYYTLKYDYIEYFAYVNAMLRSAAFFLGIQDETLDVDDETTGKNNGKKLGKLNWYFDNNGSGNNFDNNGLSKFLGTYAGAIPFYVEAETRISDDFGNSTTQSSLSSKINGLSDTARELNYLMGNAFGAAGVGGLYDDLMSVGSDAVNDFANTADSMLFRGNILSNITTKLQTILTGGRMIFPEIWSESSFSRSYRCTVKLASPSGDKLSIFYNIFVPLYHLIALVLPRNSSAQTYYSPFLVRAYYKGIFNIDMGIITDMSVSKGGDGEWTPDGLPTSVEVSFDIKDLYESLSMSKAEAEKDQGILSNISELDYIANMCGININEPDVTRTIGMAVTLGLTDKIEDKITMNIFGNIGQYFNQKIQNIFGRF